MKLKQKSKQNANSTKYNLTLCVCVSAIECVFLCVFVPVFCCLFILADTRVYFYGFKMIFNPASGLRARPCLPLPPCSSSSNIHLPPPRAPRGSASGSGRRLLSPDCVQCLTGNGCELHASRDTRAHVDGVGVASCCCCCCRALSF